jgi:hypothetical protein
MHDRTSSQIKHVLSHPTVAGAAQAQHHAHKLGRKPTPPSAGAQRYAPTWILLPPARTVAQAVAEYAGRMSSAETSQEGQRVSTAPVGQQRRAQGTVSNRVRWFWGGQRLLGDPGYDGSGGLAPQWASLGLPVAVTHATTVFERGLAEAA